MRKIILAASFAALMTAPALAQTPAPFQTNESIQVINAPAAYAKGFDGSGVLIAIIDDGYDLTHPAFQQKIVEALNTAGAGSITSLFHGTHVTGIASGIAPGANLALYTYARPLNSPTPFLAAAARRPAVISNSWGIDVDVNEILNQPSFSTSPYQALSDRLGPTGLVDPAPTDFKAFTDALISAQQHSVILFAASNDPTLPDMDISAGLPLVIPRLQDAWIAVVNVDQNGDVISVTCGSAAQFCLAAPGSDILSSVPGGGYGTATGTSMATPHVAGAVAIARQIFPEASPSQLTSLVLQTATDAGAPGVDPVYGWGILNVGNIVDTIEPRTAATFANASWSRFATLGHAGAALRQRLTLPASASGASVANNRPAHYASLRASADGGIVGVSDPKLSGIWVAPVYGRSTISAGQFSREARAHTMGGLVGIDLLDHTLGRFGIAGGYTHTRLSTRGAADSGTSDAFHAGIYGSFNVEGWFGQGSGLVGFFDQTLTRHEISGAQGTSRTPIGRSSFRGTAFEADARLGHTYELGGGATLSPYAAINARWQQTNSFREVGAGIFSLNVPSSSMNQFAFGPGLRWSSAPIEMKHATLRFETDIAYARMTGDLRNKTDVSLLGRRIEGSTAEIGRDVLHFGGQLKISGDDEQFSGFVGYNGSLQKRTVSHSVSAGLRINF